MNTAKKYLIIVGILLVGLLLRLFHNTDISLWHDEAFSALLIKYPWGEMMYRIGLDVHPPLYYIALRLWHYALGDSLLSLRGFSIFFGLATALAAFGFVRAAFRSEKAAYITLLLVVCNPFQLQYATEARMYTFGAFLAVLTAYFLARALIVKKASEGQTRPIEWVWWLAFGISAAAAALTHYYLLFTVAALCLYALCWHVYNYRFTLKRYIPLSVSYVLIAALFAPWLRWFLYQFKQVGAGYWIPPMDKWSIPTTLWEMVLKFPYSLSDQRDQILVLVITLCIFLVVLYTLHVIKNGFKWLVLFGFLAPFGGSLLFLAIAHLKGQESSVYLVRYFIYASTFLAILLSLWFSSFSRKSVTIILTTAYILANILSFHVFWKNLDVATKPGMGAAVTYLQKNLRPQDALFVGTSFEFFNLKYYLSQTTPPALTVPGQNMTSRTFALEDLSDDAQQSTQMAAGAWPRPLLFTGGATDVSSMPHFAGTAILTNDDLVPRFEEAVKPGDTVWLLWTNGFGSNKPKTPPNWKQMDEAGFAEVRPYVGTWIVITKYLVQ